VLLDITISYNSLKYYANKLYQRRREKARGKQEKQKKCRKKALPQKSFTFFLVICYKI